MLCKYTFSVCRLEALTHVFQFDSFSDVPWFIPTQSVKKCHYQPNRNPVLE